MTIPINSLVGNSAICLILLFNLNACKNQKELASPQPERTFIMGSGGGFTGKYVIYKIHSTGEIELQNEDLSAYNVLKSIPLDSAMVCFETLDALNISDFTFNHPGNMTYLIEIENDGKSHKIKWGDISHPIRKDIEAFYKRTRKMIQADY